MVGLCGFDRHANKSRTNLVEPYVVLCQSRPWCDVGKPMIIDLTRDEKRQIAVQCAHSAVPLCPNPWAEMCTIVDELMREYWIPEEKHGTKSNQRTS